jgi:hypothetical protein
MEDEQVASIVWDPQGFLLTIPAIAATADCSRSAIVATMELVKRLVAQV